MCLGNLGWSKYTCLGNLGWSKYNDKNTVFGKSAGVSGRSILYVMGKGWGGGCTDIGIRGWIAEQHADGQGCTSVLHCRTHLFCRFLDWRIPCRQHVFGNLNFLGVKFCNVYRRILFWVDCPRLVRPIPRWVMVDVQCLVCGVPSFHITGVGWVEPKYKKKNIRKNKKDVKD